MTVDPGSRGWNEHRHRWDVPVGTIQTADLADGSVTTPKLANLAVTAAKIANGAVGTTQLAAGAAQALLGSYRSNPVWSTTLLNQWVETPFTVTVTCLGGGIYVRLHGILPLYHSVAGAGVYVAWGVDHVATVAVAFFNTPAVQYTITSAFTDYYTPAAGSRVFSLFVQTNTAGTLTFNAAINAQLSITEERR